MDEFDLIMLRRQLAKLDKLDSLEDLEESMADLGAAMGDLEEKLDYYIELLEAAMKPPRKPKLKSA